MRHRRQPVRNRSMCWAAQILYVAKIPNCEKGGRNNAAFKCAVKLVNDFLFPTPTPGGCFQHGTLGTIRRCRMMS